MTKQKPILDLEPRNGMPESHVIIHGVPWEIRKTGNMLQDDGGETHYSDCLCLINNRDNRYQQARTFWHELFHMMWESYDWDKDKKYTEEEIATMLGPALFDFFERNANIDWMSS